MMKSVATFHNRRQAGAELASRLTLDANTVVLAIPRGGIDIGCEAARLGRVPLDVLVPRKLRAPEAPELSLGAVCAGGSPVYNQRLIDTLQITSAYLRREVARQQEESQRQRRWYLGLREPVDLEGRRVVLTDDGVASGYTMRAAIQRVARDNPASITVAVPAAPARALELLTPHADEIVVLYTPSDFDDVSEFYEQFDPPSDEEAAAMLDAFCNEKALS
jgi:putative phosphoribosyl transferase